MKNGFYKEWILPFIKDLLFGLLIFILIGIIIGAIRSAGYNFINLLIYISNGSLVWILIFSAIILILIVYAGLLVRKAPGTYMKKLTSRTITRPEVRYFNGKEYEYRVLNGKEIIEGEEYGITFVVTGGFILSFGLMDKKSIPIKELEPTGRNLPSMIVECMTLGVSTSNFKKTPF